MTGHPLLFFEEWRRLHRLCIQKRILEASVQKCTTQRVLPAAWIVRCRLSQMAENRSCATAASARAMAKLLNDQSDPNVHANVEKVAIATSSKSSSRSSTRFCEH